MLVKKTVEFDRWFDKESAKSKTQIAVRVKNIQEFNHFGWCRDLGDSLVELKWKNGRRVYFTIYKEKEKITLLLIGGYKNAQDKDIKKARKIIKKYKD